MHGIQSAISAIAVHPKLPILAIAGSEGFIQIWDYLQKGDPISNYDFFKKEDTGKNSDGKIFTCIEFTPDGKEILVAQYNGEIKIMDSETGKFKKLGAQPLKTREDKPGPPITQMIITDDGKFFACSDKNRTVSLFKKDHPVGDPSGIHEWQFNGKVLSHEIEVSSIAFGSKIGIDGQREHILFSIGKDRRLFEYNVYKSTFHT